MPAVFINAGAVLIGSILGLIFRDRLNERLQNTLIVVLGLCTAAIGATSAIATADTLCLTLSMIFGTLIGEAIDIDRGIERLGDAIKGLVKKQSGGSRFSEGFLSASILFCIGPMTIMGSLKAGINGDFSIIVAKSVLDCISAMAFASAMGIGVAFSSLFVLLFQGAITLFAVYLGSAFSAPAVTEMSAVGGTILLGMSINMLSLRSERIRVANMLPAIFLPLAYLPIREWLTGIL